MSVEPIPISPAVAQAIEAWTKATPKPKAKAPDPSSWDQWSELVKTDFPPLRFAVEGILPDGLTVFFGPPKSMKSMLVKNLMLGVAAGGRALGGMRATSPAPVLYLALEDSRRRLKDHIVRMTGGDFGGLPNVHSVNTWPALGEGGLDAIAAWFDGQPEGGLVVIDTIGRLRGAEQAEGNNYERDVHWLSALQQLAVAQPGRFILLVHHTRKADSADWPGSASGSYGLTGTADTIWSLERERGSDDGLLRVTGRDVADMELSLHWDAESLTWSEIKPELEGASTTVRTHIQSYLGTSGRAVDRLCAVMGKKGISRALADAALVELEAVHSERGGKAYVSLPKGRGQLRFVEPAPMAAVEGCTHPDLLGEYCFDCKQLVAGENA